ncbi:MAG: dTDP-3-amino-3,6-dideoxy-alpha-D-glucopyranose N,N-dimethyltransferase [Anaerolineales bacterium]|nr:dTDP-3-amino-3,6-dideoxy-alpha-D-glucopyranose N,N-dimethyltransferase [Anaerolineales bacterium]
MLKLYNELAAWWSLLSPVEDYEEEAAFFGDTLAKAGLPTSPSLLELGCGGGSNAYYLKKMFARVTLTDISPAMLKISQALNPECEHLEADMRTVRLGREFDAVFVHDAIDYMITPQELKQAMETAFVHCKPGGVALFVPDDVTESFEPSTESDGSDGVDRAARYIEWSYDPDETDNNYTVEYAYLLRERDGSVHVEHEQHLIGLFPHDEWIRMLREVGFEAESVRDPYERDIFVARKPAKPIR